MSGCWFCSQEPLPKKCGPNVEAERCVRVDAISFEPLSLNPTPVLNFRISNFEFTGPGCVGPACGNFSLHRMTYLASRNNWSPVSARVTVSAEYYFIIDSRTVDRHFLKGFSENKFTWWLVVTHKMFFVPIASDSENGHNYISIRQQILRNSLVQMYTETQLLP